MKPPLFQILLVVAAAALLAASTVTAASCDDIMCPAVVIPLPKECTLRTTHQIPADVCTCVWDTCSCGYSCRFPQCSHKNTTVTCPAEPCTSQNCAYGCTNDYCNGCNGYCWEKPYNPTNPTTTGSPTGPTTPVTTKPPCDGICPAVVVPLPDGCQIRNINATSECLCDWDQCSCGWQCSMPAGTPCPNPVQCLVDPCSTTTCREGTTCQSSYCGTCTATCVPNPPITTKPPCNNVCAAMIEPPPTGCQIRHPNATSECLCDWDQCSCKYQCSIPSVTPCPNPVQCLVDPCSTTTCRNGTRCQSNYCGACTATCIAIEEGPNPTDCPNPVQCLVDPCSTTNCSIGTTCKSNYCGGCTATCVPNASGPTRPTPDCPNPVQCLVNPCATMLCASGTVCEADYCNGCNATCKPIATEKPPMNCDGVKCVDPCIRMTCITGSTCVKTDCCTATCSPTTTPTNANDTSTKCLHNGQIYSNGQTIEDGCNTCICQNGSMICTARACASSTSGISNDTCIYNGQTYTHGQSVKSTDGCNTCTCTNNGGMACTLMACSSTGNNNNNVTCTAFGRTYTPGQSMLSLDGCNTCRCGNDGQIECTLMACLNNTATYVGVTPAVLFATSVALAMIV